MSRKRLWGAAVCALLVVAMGVLLLRVAVRASPAGPRPAAALNTRLDPTIPLTSPITAQEQITHTLYLPLVTRSFREPTPTIIATIEVLTPIGFQPLDFSVVGSVTPTVRIGGDLHPGFRIFNDRPDGRAGFGGGPNGNGKEITQLFTQVRPRIWQASFNVLAGSNTILVIDQGATQVKASATMLNYSLAFEDLNGNGILDTGEDLNHNGVLDPGEDINGNGILDIDEDFNGNGVLDPGEDLNRNELLDFNEDLNGNGILTIDEDFDGDGILDPNEDFDTDGEISPFSLGAASDFPTQPGDFGTIDETGLTYSLRVVFLDFVDDADDVAISRFLRANNLRSLGISVDNTIVTKPKIITAEVPAEVQVLDLVKQLNRLPVSDFPFFPPLESLPVSQTLEVVALFTVTERPDVAAEALPARLVHGAPAPPSGGNAGDAYYPATGGFDNDDDGGVANDFDELDIFWPHFYMETFAAHRLVDKLVEGIANPERPLIAQIDSGLGGVGAGGAFTPPADIPAGCIVNPTDCTVNPCAAVPLANIADTAGHGNLVAHVLAGQGARVLGIGKDVRLRPFFGGQASNPSNDGRGVVVAATDPAVRVILIESQEIDLDLNNDGAITNVIVAGVNELQNAVQTLNNSATNANWGQAVNTVVQVANDKIVVIPAGNHNHDTSFTLLGGPMPTAQGQLNSLFNAPIRGTRAAGAANSLIMGISNSSIETPPLGRELRAATSNLGTRISVSAPGGDHGPPDNRAISLRPNQTFRRFGGTSHAGPQVTGLAGELIFLDDNLTSVGPFDPNDPTAANRGNFLPLQIVELIEATADDLGTNRANTPFVNDAPGNGSDNHFGFGRISVWKAVLSAVNGGLAQESAQVGQFQSLNRINEANTRWYGFKIITSVKGATVWVDGEQLKDTGATLPDPDGAPGATTDRIKAYKGVRSDQAILIGVDDDNDSVPPNDIRLDEDPTSGVVPVGNNGGEYIITFSITRDKLVGPGGAYTRTLSLRRPGDDRDDSPFYNLRLELQKMRDGHVPGVVFDDFVFEITPVDFGDAQDGEGFPAFHHDYPTLLVTSNGARHLNTNLEWFGPPGVANVDAVSPEPNAGVETDPRAPDATVDPDGLTNIGFTSIDFTPQDRDRFDDGVTFFPLTYEPGKRGKVEFWVCVADADSGRYGEATVAPTRTITDGSLYVNAWIDWDTDGMWEEENEEHIIDGLRINPGNLWEFEVLRHRTTTVTPGLTAPDLNCAQFEAEFDVGNIGNEFLWTRFRLDYGEDVGRNDPRPLFRSDPSLRDPALREDQIQPAGANRGYVQGAARFGEVEDYLVGTDFGDARDPFKGAGRYPTLLENEGAYHLDIHREWLGWDAWASPSVSRERDACDRTTDQDGHPNLDPDNQEPVPDPDPNKPNCDDEDRDHLDDGLILPASFSPGITATIQVRIHSTISARGYEYSVPEGHQSLWYETRPPQCEPITVHVLDSALTPPWSRGKGRYDPTDNRKRLWLSVWADWNGDGDWEDEGELIISGPVDPPEPGFGLDDRYTLGEPFEDLNGDGVWEQDESFTDVAGRDFTTLSCEVPVPQNIKPYFYIRARLDYGENAVQDDGVVHHADADDRALSGPKGGALWGEVEGYPSKPILSGINATFILFEESPLMFDTQVLVNVGDTYTGPLIYDLELLLADQDPVWTTVQVLDLPDTWDWELIIGGIDELAGIRLYTEDAATALGPGSALRFDLSFAVEGETPLPPDEIWIHATDIGGINLGYVVSTIIEPASLTVHVQDESGFPPPSEGGVRDISDVPVALYDPDTGFIVQGLTNASGMVIFHVTPGDYTLAYGGSTVPPSSAIGTPMRAQPITVNEGENTITVNAPWIAWHDYDTGLPLEFNFIDLDPLTAGHQREVVVIPGATAIATVSWWELSVVNYPDWYVSLFGDWQPTEPLVNVKSGTAGPSSDTLHTETITFEAPTSPGVYKVRLLDVLDVTWPPSFYTAHHYYEPLERDMSVKIIGKSNYVDYGEGTITVVGGPTSMSLRVQNENRLPTR